mmetsp:Transcript_22029/g.61681  ORF Transcript_22029/g.61681 Transcript_22029/m.61681 type:complete len:214 (+) Transcript_22029:495-1136(+)
MAVLVPYLEFTLIFHPLGPRLDAATVLEVARPLAGVRRVPPVDVHAIAIGHVILPLADVNVTIAVPEETLAMCRILLPLAMVGRAVLPFHLAYAMSHAVLPAADVCRARLEDVNLAILRDVSVVRGNSLELIVLAFEIAREVLLITATVGLRVGARCVHLRRRRRVRVLARIMAQVNRKSVQLILPSTTILLRAIRAHCGPQRPARRPTLRPT